MEEKKDYRIMAGVETIQGEGYKMVDSNDKLEKIWNPNWFERLRDYVGYFRILLTDDIEKTVGEKGWCIYFIQISPFDVSFFADVSVNTMDKFPKIVSILERKIPGDFKITIQLKPRHFTDDGTPA